jgi:hypothetical protein
LQPASTSATTQMSRTRIRRGLARKRTLERRPPTTGHRVRKRPPAALPAAEVVDPYRVLAGPWGSRDSFGHRPAMA